MNRIGILGGTFNPIHIGHLAMAQMVLDHYRLSKVIFVPSYIPPHKNSKNIISAKHRLAMVKLVVKDNSKFEVSDVEIKRKGKSYTVDTVEHFSQKFQKKTKLYFIIGGDMLLTLKTWKRIDDILKLVSIVAVNRPEYKKKGKLYKHYSVVMPGLDVSASRLRKQIVQRKSIKYLVPDKVIQYIKKHNLYR